MAHKQKNKVGRPKLPESKAKSFMLRARVSKGELETVENAAQTDGKDVSEWIREKLMVAASSRKA